MLLNMHLTILLANHFSALILETLILNACYFMTKLQFHARAWLMFQHPSTIYLFINHILVGPSMHANDSMKQIKMELLNIDVILFFYILNYLQKTKMGIGTDQCLLG